MSGGIRSFNNGYAPNTWATGDVITANKLNNMEQGIEEALSSSPSDNNIFIIEISTGDNVTINKTYAQILEAKTEGKILVPIFHTSNGAGYNVGNAQVGEGVIMLSFIFISGDSDSVTITKPTLYLTSGYSITYSIITWTADATENIS